MNCRLCGKVIHSGPCYPNPRYEGAFGWGIKIMDETEQKRVVVVGARSYEVPKEVADEIDELRQMVVWKKKPMGEWKRDDFMSQALNEGDGSYRP